MPLEIENVFGEMKKFREAFNEVRANPPWLSADKMAARRWNPYSFEGGTGIAIAGEDFVVAGTDTRLTQFEVNVLTREAKKMFILNENIVLVTNGFYGDVLQLTRLLEARLSKFRFDYREEMTVDLCAEMLSRTLYYRRFFPYLTGAVLVGVDEHGKGAIFGYDPTGMIQRKNYLATGNGVPLVMPFLDTQVGHMTLSEDVEKPELTLERAVKLLKDSFMSTAEREITTGDHMDMVIMQKGQPVKREYLPLRND